MLKPGMSAPLGMGLFALFAVLAGLALLMATNHAAPGCTGPAVARCDYVAVATDALEDRGYSFRPTLATGVYDEGSSVRVQQIIPFDPNALVHGSSVLIDKRSCRVCMIDDHQMAENGTLGRLLMRAPAVEALG
ncbi:hypothetical protein Q0812_01535 [Brevundimonas sp. 2R-24]|uniref:Uncharacterized protein n=1 Tax=Peiella sedimenti TaxID=3061083 RepID=A0ABT8SJ77_9CAUL|nr:hypothetical protein [Caulobacteraceae bacterium XZ-24]